MLKLIVALLMIVPIVEIWGLIAVGQWIGVWPTIFTVILTAFIGGILAKSQGLKVVQLIQLQLSRGEMPGNAIIDGVCILTGGILLMTPGFFTDLLGIVLLVPYTRGIVKLWIKQWLYKLIRDGKTVIIRRF